MNVSARSRCFRRFTPITTRLQSTMSYGRDVTLLCQPDTGNRDKSLISNVMGEAVMVAVLVASVLSLIIALPLLQFNLGQSERETATQDPLIDHEVNEEAELVDLVRESLVMQSGALSVQEQEEAAATDYHQVEVVGAAVTEEDLSDPLEYSDELEGLMDTVGSDPADPDAVAFLLPLRGHTGNLGISYGRRLKQILETAADSARQAAAAEKGPHAINRSSNVFLPTSVLVRDSQSDPDIARKLTQHFYEVHGTTRYFGYLTDEEALTVAHWARAKAPGARFVTPTAISTYLESARNVARVQPSARVLAAAVGDFLATIHTHRPLVVARASLHTDAFLSLLHAVGLRPNKVMHYYETTHAQEMVERVKTYLAKDPSPVLLLGNAESWHLIMAADRFFPAVWILPFQTQLHDHMRTNQSELITFMYRAYDDVPKGFLREELLLSPSESTVLASMSLLTGRQRKWHGSYVVAASVPVASIAASVRLVGASDGWLPLLQYDMARRSITRRLYQELLVTRELLKPLVSGDNCTLVLRYIEELTGSKRVSEIPVHSTLPTLLMPAERGAHVHVDCPRHHTDLRCSAPSGSWAPVTCRGALQGSHRFQAECGKEVGITVAASRGCTASQGLVCRSGHSLGCLLSGFCSTLTHSPPLYDCAGLHLDTLFKL
ncbi:uncharacterized protein [Cherax quadricarinatus]